MPSQDNFFDHCLISDAQDIVPLKGYEKDFLVKSKSSGFVFCSKIPTQKELADYYSTYDNQDYLSPITIKRFNDLLDSFEPYRKTNKLLDIGCGVGFLLEMAKERGWEVYGTEYTQTLLDICVAKGINMHQGKLDAAWFEPGSFDVITSIEVLEHINNPQDEIKTVSTILRSGGLFYFTTPNFNALERFILKGEYNVINYPEHLSYYTPKTIDLLLKRFNFKKKKLLTTGISFTRIKTSKGISSEKMVSEVSTDEVVRNKIENNGLLKFAKNLANSVLSNLGVGNSLKGWYIKI